MCHNLDFLRTLPSQCQHLIGTYLQYSSTTLVDTEHIYLQYNESYRYIERHHVNCELIGSNYWIELIEKRREPQN